MHMNAVVKDETQDRINNIATLVRQRTAAQNALNTLEALTADNVIADLNLHHTKQTLKAVMAKTEAAILALGVKPKCSHGHLNVDSLSFYIGLIDAIDTVVAYDEEAVAIDPDGAEELRNDHVGGMLTAIVTEGGC
jgi:hypothetical protein